RPRGITFDLLAYHGCVGCHRWHTQARAADGFVPHPASNIDRNRCSSGHYGTHGAEHQCRLNVHELAAHTVGGVIDEGDTVMQIVPRADELVVEAKVAPHDFDQVASGATAVVRIMAGNQRTTPVITGRVTRVSADIERGTTGLPATTAIFARAEDKSTNRVIISPPLWRMKYST